MGTLPPAAFSGSTRAFSSAFPRDAAVLGCIVTCSLLLRIWWFGSPVVDHDEQFYSLVGREMLAGKLPYVDIWDRKPIGLFLIYAAAHGLFGPSSAAYLAVADIFAIAGAWLVFRIASILADRATGVVAALLQLLGMFMYGCRGGQAELFMVVPCLAMTWLIIARAQNGRAMALAMLLGGIAIQIKSSAAPFCVVFGMAVLVERWRIGRSPVHLAAEAALYGVIGLAPTLVVVLAYVAMGHFDAFFYANFLSVFDRPPVIGRWAPLTLPVIGPLVLALVAGVWAWFRTGRTYPARAYALVAVMAAGALAAIFFTANVLAHYYAFLVPWAVLLAVPFIDLRAPSGRFGALLVMGAWLVAADIPERIAEMRADRAAFARLVAIIGADGPGRGLYVFTGPTELYPATGNDGGRYPYPSHHANRLEMGGLGVPQQALVAEALARKPAFIVTRPDYAAWPDPLTVPLVVNETRAHYRQVAHVTLLDDDLVVWRRR